MALIQRCHALELHKHKTFNQKIGYIFANDATVVFDCYRLLLGHMQTSFANFECEIVLVDLLKKAVAEGVADPVGASDDSLGYLVQSVFICAHLCSSVVLFLG
jgi:hypothetical protein